MHKASDKCVTRASTIELKLAWNIVASKDDVEGGHLLAKDVDVFILVHLFIESRVQRIPDGDLPGPGEAGQSSKQQSPAQKVTQHAKRRRSGEHTAGRAPIVQQSPDSSAQHQRQPAHRQQ